MGSEMCIRDRAFSSLVSAVEGELPARIADKADIPISWVSSSSDMLWSAAHATRDHQADLSSAFHFWLRAKAAMIAAIAVPNGPDCPSPTSVTHAESPAAFHSTPQSVPMPPIVQIAVATMNRQGTPRATPHTHPRRGPEDSSID